MLIEGEKYACDACVRGHRVSNCQHSDRPLTHINKKGRPVSQCPHCRGLRKSRSSHVKCECGEKPHHKGDCAHTEKAESKQELGVDSIGSASDYSTVESSLCCCSHGGRCKCALKKEHLDPVPEVDVSECPSVTSLPGDTKPRLSSTQSDNALTVFANGHHKPAHKHNDAAHKCGLPYTIPRPHTIHGHTSAQRSLDSLPLIRTYPENSSQFQESISSAQQDVRLVRSEHNSPDVRPVSTVGQVDGLPPIDLCYSPFENTTTSPFQDVFNNQSSTGFESYYTNPEDRPVLSAGLSIPNEGWSAVDLPLENGAVSSSYSQPPSYASLDHSNFGQPGLTASSSGEVSEVEDYLSHALPSPPIQDTNQYPSSSSKMAEQDMYRLSSSSSYMGIPQTSSLASSNLENIDMESYLGCARISPSDLEDSNGQAKIDPEAFTRHGITVQDAQKLAHPSYPTEAMNDLSLPAHSKVDSPWRTSFIDTDDAFIAPSGECEDDAWQS
ncbi:hypothetical protein MMC20_007165 [Loxospora ochrophaea]|nr:hypothetical protein [Loxospora ochrophaea]